MMMNRTCGFSWRNGMQWILVTALFLSLGSSVGCLGRSPGVEHFVLGSAAGDSAATATESTATLSDLAIVVGPVRLPPYLDRPQLARLESGGEIELDEFTRWLGGFEDNFLRALALDVASRTGSIKVTNHPSKAPFPADVHVKLHIDDLVSVDGSALRVRIRWALVRAGAEAPATLFSMDSSIPLASSSNRSIVVAYDAAVTELGRRIVAALAADEG